MTRPPVFDCFTTLPTPERAALEIRSWGSDAGYRGTFGNLWGSRLGVPTDVVQAVAELPSSDFLSQASDLLRPHLPPLAKILGQIREAGIVRAVVHGPLMVDVPYPNEATAELVASDPALLVGFARVDPSAGQAAGDEVERAISKLGLSGVTITPFWHGVRCSDAVVEPVFEAARSAGVPVWVHTSMNWQRDRPLDLELPEHVDRVAGRFPEVPIICGHGGWPWVNQMVAVAWRHPKVYIDISAFRPRHVFAPGSGWESLVYYGARTISQHLLFGSTWGLLGLSPTEAVEEAWSVPWPDAVKERWLYENGASLFGGQ